MKSKLHKKRLGFQRERELVRQFWKRGFACMRAPASGAKTKRTPYPDIVAIKNGRIFIIEVKTREKRSTVYIPNGQMLKLLEFSRRSGGLALIALKFIDGSGWRFIEVSKLERTRSGNWKVTPEMWDEGLTIEDLDRMCRGEKSLEEYIKS